MSLHQTHWKLVRIFQPRVCMGRNLSAKQKRVAMTELAAYSVRGGGHG